MRSFSGVIATNQREVAVEVSLEEQADKLKASLKKIANRLDKKTKQRASTRNEKDFADLDRQILRLRQLWAKQTFQLQHLNDKHVSRNRKWSNKKAGV